MSKQTKKSGKKQKTNDYITYNGDYKKLKKNKFISDRTKKNIEQSLFFEY